MNEAIVVDNLSKQYTLGETHRDMTFRETLVKLARAPFNRRNREIESIWALHDVSFSVNEGEVVGMVGRNGAGKSTLLKVLSRITHPTGGSISIRGRVSSLLEVGTGFHNELTGRENIYLNGSIMGMKRSEIKATFDQIVAFSGVEQFIDTPIKRYSSGMRLRLGFAVAAHLSPDVLLVDEVLAVGDAEFQKKCLQAMDDLRSSGRTVVFVSHNMAAIENLCPRVVWIDGGRVRRDGACAPVLKEYLATFAGARQAGADLRTVKGRRGTQDIQFTGIEFMNAEREPIGFIRTAESVTVRLYYEAHRRVRLPHFGIEISTDMGTLVADLSTWSAGLDIPHIDPGEGHLDVEIGPINLLPSRYYISLWLESVGGLSYDMLDRCTSFDVEMSDFYGSGKGMDSQFGIICLPTRWSLEGMRKSTAVATSAANSTEPATPA